MAGPLPGAERIYSIHGDGIQANPSNPSVINPAYPPVAHHADQRILKLGNETTLAPRLDKMLFRLSVPRPQYIFPLYFDNVEVVAGYDQMPTNHLAGHCTGLRFFYVWDAMSAIKLVIPSGYTLEFTPPVFTELPTIADIEVRYEGLNLADENDPHSDARSCFASLATLAGVEMWLNYGDGRSSPTNPSCASGNVYGDPQPCEGVTEPLAGQRPNTEDRPSLLLHTGADCYAPIIVSGLD